jgi:hypothetical protein
MSKGMNANPGWLSTGEVKKSVIGQLIGRPPKRPTPLGNMLLKNQLSCRK